MRIVTTGLNAFHQYFTIELNSLNSTLFNVLLASDGLSHLLPRIFEILFLRQREEFEEVT